MYVCICNKVTDSAIEEALASGQARSFEDIQQSLGVATQCGKCTGCAKRIIREHQARRLFTIQQLNDPFPSNA